MAIEVFDADQGSAAWYAARLGLPTASRFADILAKGEGKMRSRYLRDLAGEIMTEEVAESYSNQHMERGHAMEDEARSLYAFMHDADPLQVGFIRNGRAGCSPDSLIGEDGGLEIKTALPAIQIERLQRGGLPPEHRAQVQGSLWVSEREWWDFVSYWPKLPPLIVRVYRDEDYIRQLAGAVDAFNEELDALVASIRTYQNFRAAAAA